MKSAAARALKTPAIGRNAVAGYAVAIKTETGKVVAMASMPDYDPNIWIGGIGSTEEYLRIQPYVNNGTITTAYPDYPPEERNRHPNSIVYLRNELSILQQAVGEQPIFLYNEEKGLMWSGLLRQPALSLLERRARRRKNMLDCRRRSFVKYEA